MADGNVNEIADADLLRRAISSLHRVPRTKRAKVVPMWASVSKRFGLGSTYAAQLCRRFGFDPDQQVRP